jgi:predicted esterase
MAAGKPFERHRMTARQNKFGDFARKIAIRGVFDLRHPYLPRPAKPMHRRNLILGCFLVLAASFPSGASAINVADFTDYSLRDANSQILLPGRLYVPPEAMINLAAPRPLIVFLHGGGAAGTDNMRQLNQDIEQLAIEAERRGAFLYAPQAPLNWRPRTITDRVITMLDRALVDHNVDGTRMYLTGYSSGGGGTWNMLSRYPERFAAAVPVAPVSAEPDFMPANLVGQPIAVFHARNDSVAPVSTTRSVINRILTAANQPVPSYPAATAPDFTFSVAGLDLHYIEPASGDHSVLFSVYNRPQLYDWMFSHTPEPGTAMLLLIGAMGVVGNRRGRRSRATRHAVADARAYRASLRDTSRCARSSAA